jgi:hypothetical protein
MGMYNEVSKACPECGHVCIVQISQIELGFGDYSLDNLSTMEHLSDENLVLLKEYLEHSTFYCQCGNSFKYKPQNKNRVRDLLGLDSQENETQEEQDR